MRQGGTDGADRLAKPAGLSPVAVLPLAGLVLVTVLMLLFRERLDKAHIALLYLLVVLGGSVAGRMAGIGIGVLAFLLFNFLFLQPLYTFTVTDPLDWLVLLAFLVTSMVAAQLLHRQRVQTQLALQRGREFDQLAMLGTETLNAARAEHALQSIAHVIRTQIDAGRCELFVRAADQNSLIADTRNLEESTSTGTAPPDGLVAYVAESGHAAIARQDGTVRVVAGHADIPTLLGAGAQAYAMPLTVRGQIVGALRVSSPDGLMLSANQLRVLEALAYYAALAIERLRLENAEMKAEELRRVDVLKDALLAAVSHDLRTPLTTIKGLAHELAADGSARATIIEKEADQLSALVDGLLELSQLNANAMSMNLQVNTADELVGAALQRATTILGNHVVAVTHVRDDMQIGTFDFAQSLRILVNLLENAAKYSPPGSSIEVVIDRAGPMIEISVRDSGPGVPSAEVERIFEPFYRAGGAPADVRGAGLGLSIARRLARAQHGDLTVAARREGGAVFTLSIPADIT
jgi:two-component system, OmpR family, sensor histidine kinase KdpD